MRSIVRQPSVAGPRAEFRICAKSRPSERFEARIRRSETRAGTVAGGCGRRIATIRRGVLTSLSMRYELTDLKLFMEIAAAGSLSRSASAVHITASSASYRLKNLEQVLGTPLFDRTPRGMSLTQAGEAMLGHVRELFEGVGSGCPPSRRISCSSCLRTRGWRSPGRITRSELPERLAGRRSDSYRSNTIVSERHRDTQIIMALFDTPERPVDQRLYSQPAGGGSIFAKSSLRTAL